MSLYNYLDGSLKNLFSVGATDKTKISTSATQSTITPSSNSSTAIVFTKLDGTTPVGKFDIANTTFSLPNTSVFSIGKSDTTDVYLKADVSGQIGTPAIRYYNSTGKWQYSNDGSTYTNFSLANAVPPGQASQLLQTNIDASDTAWVTPEYVGGDDMWSSNIPLHPNMTGRKEAVIASAGTKICMGLGIDAAGNYKNDWYVYDVKLKTWTDYTATKPFPGAGSGRAGAWAVGINNAGTGWRVYVGWGRNSSGTCYTDLYYFDPFVAITSSTVWVTPAANINNFAAIGGVARSNASACPYYSGGTAYIQVGHGRSAAGNAINDWYYLNIASGYIANNLVGTPASARWGGISGAYLANIYVGLGYNGTNCLSDFYVYNGTTWSALASFPEARKNCHYAMVGTRLYVGGGSTGSLSDGSESKSTWYYYDITQPTATGVWVAVYNSHPGGARELAYSCMQGARIYTFGGIGPAGIKSDFYWYGKTEASSFTYANLERAYIDYNGLIVRDTTLTGTTSKAFRFRVSGGSMDFDSGGQALYISTYAVADFTSTQNNILQASVSGATCISANTISIGPGPGSSGDFTGLQSSLYSYRVSTSPIVLRTIANYRGMDTDFSIKRKYSAGAWSATYTYAQNDYASYGGVNFKSLANSNLNNTCAWTTWTSGTTFMTNDRTLSTTGALFRSLVDNNINHAVTAGAYWAADTWWTADYNYAHTQYNFAADGSVPMALAYDAGLDILTFDVPFNVKKKTTKSLWNTTTTYAVNDQVWYNGVLYIAILGLNTNRIPYTATTYWRAYNDQTNLALSYDQAASDTFNFNAVNHVFGTDPTGASIVRVGGDVKAHTFTSSQATGTAPFTIASTTAVANLNSDMVDGKHASDLWAKTDTLQIGDSQITPVVGDVGKVRYYESGNNSYTDVVMRTGSGTYAWVNVMTQSW